MIWKKPCTMLLNTALILILLAGCRNDESPSDSSFLPPFSVPEDTAIDTPDLAKPYIYNKYFINPYIDRTLKPDEQLYRRLFDLVENVDAETDVSDLSFDEDQFANTVLAVMDRLEFPYIRRIALSNGTTAIATYTTDKETALADQEGFRSKVENILSTVVSSDQSELQNALALFDYLCQTVTYASNGQGTSGFDALVNGTAICYGYSYALVYLLDQIGIESYTTSSSDQSHMWVIAKLDGAYYHLDPTNGLSFFALSDAAKKRDYDDWYCGNMNYNKETPPACITSTFDFLLDSYSIQYNRETETLSYTDATNLQKEILIP